MSVQCLELTDHSACILYYAPSASGQCNRNWGKDVGTWADMGIHAQDSGNVSLQNLNIHGFADRGVMAGRIHDWNVSDVVVRANGWAGWDGDLGGNNHNSTNSGNLTFDHLTVEWNGCAEAYPSTTIINCWGQNEGGYGDGFAEAWTGGNFIFTNSQFLHNASDGLDLLYANGTGSIMLDRVYAAFSAGNQIKTSGTATLQNSVINGYCNDWQPPMPIAGDGSSGVAGTMCRADGTAVVMEFVGKSEKVLLQYNTITGNGDTLFVGGGETMTPDASDVTTFSNNIWLGQNSVIPRDDGNYTALDWYTDGTYYGVVTTRTISSGTSNPTSVHPGASARIRNSRMGRWPVSTPRCWRAARRSEQQRAESFWLTTTKAMRARVPPASAPSSTAAPNRVAAAPDRVVVAILLPSCRRVHLAGPYASGGSATT